MRTTRLLAILAITLIGTTGCKTQGGDPGSTAYESSFSDSINDDESFRMWFSYFYKHQNKNQTVSAIKFMGKHGYLKDHPDIASTFLSHVFADNDSDIEDWLSQLDSISKSDWDILLLALWLSNNKEAKDQMKLNLHRGMPERRSDFKLLSDKQNYVDILDVEIESPNQINLLWAAFSATGDGKYVQKIISQIHLYETDEMSMSSIVGEAAIMTLANNTMQHGIVAKICQKAHSDHPDAKTRILLNAMLSAVTEIVIEETEAESQN
jgi:hypothetical protein